MRKGKRSLRRTVCRFAFLTLCPLLPFLMGGCPEFQNQVTGAFESATRSILNAALDLLFDQFRTDSTSY